MTVFSRELLLAELPLWPAQACGLMPAQIESDNPALQAYHRHYGLDAMVEQCDYRIGLVNMPDFRFCMQRFRPEQPRGLAVVCHGYMDHMGLYGHLIQHLLAEKLEVFIYDLAGHGLSGGDPLAVDNFDEYAHQLQKVLQMVESPDELPLILVGQSTGAAVISAQQWLCPQPSLAIAHRILLAPLVRPALWRAIRRKFHMLKHFLQQVPRRYSANSHDAGFLRFLQQNDPMQHGDIPLSWISAMQAWADYIETAEAKRCAVTCVQGIADGTVDWHHNLRVLSRVYPEMRVELVEGARHHLVNESPEYRDQVFGVITDVVSALPQTRVRETGAESKAPCSPP